MPRTGRRIGSEDDNGDDAELGVLEDKTEALTLRSKRTERNKKKQTKKASQSQVRGPGLLGLPTELFLEILGQLRPSDVFSLSRTNRALRGFVLANEDIIARDIVGFRYMCLSQCYRAPVLLEDVPAQYHADLLSPDRPELQAVLRQPPPYQHVASPNPREVCTCLTCVLRWHVLCFALDFGYWQDRLDRGEPIPAIPRGTNPKWNQKLVTGAAAVARRALRSPLWHARLLESQLTSTTRAIMRHAANKGNKRRRFRMTAEDVASGSDRFLERSGPSSADFPYHRDNYYMLEAYMPGRSWIGELDGWAYMPADTHDKDLEVVSKWAKWRRQRTATESVGPCPVPTITRSRDNAS